MITIAVTDTLGSESKFQKYVTWLRGGNEAVNCKVFSYRLDNLVEFESCNALVLTGGHDVHPSLYGGPASHPKIKDIDLLRDEFERKILDRAITRGIPVLAICRGLQLANVHFGGSLLPDLEDAGYPPHRSESGSCRHDICLERGSAFLGLIGMSSGNVNSSHHQAVDRVGNGLTITARAGDGVVEAVEWSSAPSFFQLVQYHPERMEDNENPFTKRLLTEFLQSIKTKK